ncbi:hypothetical protein GCM10007415_10360 [Parapedobacter pyrenivorans]|uniref:Thioredoxin domain-containing protein n=1 Tax=Parapedobacter pyrenivorans TaxID=1305674 RepID=A0A917HIW1_9SPHI|nr:TlpA disulfide reductase family protein [Parapedobacter pyrenivorans]GGG79967.1 hypothetical protein GCM10007415_10360 [Parapedobacter pyrenivorans]
MKKINLSFGVFLFVMFTWTDSRAQFLEQPLFQNSTTSVSVGDRIPDISLPYVLDNGIVHEQALRDFDDRLLIIDFWSTYCSGCIKSFPKLDSLQRLFGDRIHVLLSTYQDEALVRQFMEKNPIGQRIKLPTVIQDTTLGGHFPHRSIPHIVWINKGVVTAITSTEYINKENVQMILDGKPVNWPVKNEKNGYDYNKPLLQLTTNRQFTDKKLQYTALMGYQDGLSGKLDISVDSISGTRRGYIINLPIVNAYFLLQMKTLDIFALHRPHLFLTPNQLVVEGLDINDIWYDRKVSGYQAAWEREHDLSLEVVLQDTNQSEQDIYLFMIAELNRLLGITARFERRTVDCWILRKISDTETSPSKTILSTTPEDAFKSLVGQGSPASDMVYRMNCQTGNPPVFDESGYLGKLDLNNPEWSDISRLNIKLKKQGLKFVSAKRNVDLFVIRKTARGNRL